MKNKAILAFLGFAAMAALPAFAQKSPSAFYIGAGLGGAISSDFCLLAGPDCKDTDTSVRGFAGYQFNRYLAVEAGYHDFGDNRDNTTTASAKGQAGELVGILSYPFLKEFAVFGKAGVYRGRLRGATPAGASFNESNTDLTLGAGLQWYLFENFSLRGEYQRYPKMGGGNSGVATDYDTWSISAIFRFD